MHLAVHEAPARVESFAERAGELVRFLWQRQGSPRQQQDDLAQWISSRQGIARDDPLACTYEQTELGIILRALSSPVVEPRLREQQQQMCWLIARCMAAQPTST